MADGREGVRGAGRIGDDSSEGEFSSAADANAKVNLERPHKETAPIDTADGGVQLAIEQSFQMGCTGGAWDSLAEESD